MSYRFSRIPILSFALGLAFLASCATVQIHDSDRHLKEGLELYSRARLAPTKRDYASDTIYVGAKYQFWSWKNSFIQKYSKDEWASFVELAIREIGLPDKDLTPVDMLEYQLEPTMR